MGEKKGDNQLFRSLNLKTSGKKLNVKYLFILLLIGVLFMMIGTFMQSNEEPASSLPVVQDEIEEEESSEVFMSNDEPQELVTMSDYERFYERQLEDILEKVVGVSDVSVMVNLAESEKIVYEKDRNTMEQFTEESDREGGTREVQDKTQDEQTVIIRTGDQEEPLIVKTQKPDIRGVLVVANGAENIQIKTWIIEAVSRGLDVPSHRVSVLPKNSKEE
ncbi:stage III sporulation protein AG [Evansella cellulosilytica]|uniref:Stage III sporulation protein AG n=1 Tax=Evansella cellulosilytica (strain ATCC 21833 / DSM 2522 / FERM P-1141 / JCM 9156 / N-4) TaxID=649639 RepID=E6TXP4_EVAC2|nr:stage III sporulation protein AG [Evansella cellulosilytica]ADU29970.1 stage III sporulation protein AG [Evansella cellulosilytica DSM 2522]